MRPGWRTACSGTCRIVVILLAGLLIAGCGLMPRARHAPPFSARNPAEPYPNIEPTAVATLSTINPTVVRRKNATGRESPAVGSGASNSRTKPLNVLAVSAGGAYCPFAAGAITGWTKAGTRPDFDVVTGTSSGALVGAFAFLGPKYDDRLESLFTTMNSDDLFHMSLGYLWRDGALASPQPMEERLERVLNEEFLADLRAAHAAGRRLFIGTTNFDTKRLVVWDVGAIASSDDPGAAMLVRKIFLASTTWPGLLPPVEFTVQNANGEWRRERHIDGGAAAQTFVRFAPMDGWPGPGELAPGWLTGSNLYIISCGKLYHSPTPAPTRFVGRILSGVSCLTHSLARADTSRMHTLCATSGMKFHLLAMPQDYIGADESIMELNPQSLRQLFDLGYRLTQTGPPWRLTPPDVEPGEEDPPRGAMRDTR